LAGRKTKGGGASAPDLSANGKIWQEKIRADKWLFFARFFKTRHIAAELITKGRLRVNGQKQSKPGHALSTGDVLTFPMGQWVRVIRVLDSGERRGPAAEAQTLYLDLNPQDGPATGSLLE
jgi:ribosome-associated heat shock protein Hsp15